MKSGSKIQLGILGGNSQISRSLVPLLAGDYAITLYSRAPAKLEPFLVDHPRVENCHLHEFGRQPLDLIINSIGCGDPAVLRETGSEVVDVTRYYDDLILRHLGSQTLGYIYLSSVAVYGPTTKFPVDPQAPAENSPGFYYGAAKQQAEHRHKSHGGPIVDLRIFGYVSDQLDLASGFLVAQIFKARKANIPFVPHGGDSLRDYIGAPELASVISRVVACGVANERIDVVSTQFTSRNRILHLMQERHGLEVQWEKPSDAERLPAAGRATLMEHAALGGITRSAEAVVAAIAEKNFA
jgi:nucleoside-diphosphate-sugar epimerase